MPPLRILGPLLQNEYFMETWKNRASVVSFWKNFGPWISLPLEQFELLPLMSARMTRVSSKVDRRSDHNAVQIGRIAGRIAKADGVDAGMQLDLENHWHRIAEGAAIEVEFSGRAVVDGHEIRTRSAGLVVNLHLIRSVRRHRDIREGY